MPPSPDAYWLALRRVRAVGLRTCRLLLENFGSAEKIFALGQEELARAGIRGEAARNIPAFRDFDEVEKELCELPRIGARLVRWTDEDYPPNLRHIPDPPPCLFVRGSPDLADPRCVAIVGARAASDAGRRMAQRLALELAAKGFTVVSGLARGIDREAHQGALDAGGRTLAVMGCGIDVVYPPEHRALADSIIASGGGLISELPIGTRPLAENFPTRNRILSGLCLGVVVVEAAEKSGSLITARMALEQNRQVFAVPGSPLTGKTRGSNRLLKQGAVLVECVEDVLEELIAQLGVSMPDWAGAAPALARRPEERRQAGALAAAASELEAPEARAILEVLKEDHKLHIDSIIEATGMNAQNALGILLELELKGLVSQHPGKLFSLA